MRLAAVDNRRKMMSDYEKALGVMDSATLV